MIVTKICPDCKNELSDKASFCGKCKTQVSCLSCEASLGMEDKCCEFCGEDVKQLTVNNGATNKIRYDGQTFEAEFTDTVGKDVTDTFGQIFLANQARFGSNQLEQGEKVVRKEHIEADEFDNGESRLNKSSSNQRARETGVIFRESKNGLDLLETRLKALGKKDYAIRLTYLVVLYFEDKGDEATKKTIINKLLNYCGVNDGNYRKWFGACSDFMVNSGMIEFRPSGRERAKKYLSDVSDEAIVGRWDLSDLKSSNAKKTTGTNSSKTKTPSKTAARSVVAEQFDAHRKDKTLKTLLEEKQPGTGTTNRILVIAYYINYILKKESFSDGNIEYAYKAMKLGKRPKHLRQTIINIKNDHTYFEDAEPVGTWKLSRDGEIFVDEELPNNG